MMMTILMMTILMMTMMTTMMMTTMMMMYTTVLTLWGLVRRGEDCIDGCHKHSQNVKYEKDDIYEATMCLEP